VESELLVESFLRYWLSLVYIENLPSLVGTVVSVPCDDLSSFLILSGVNIKAFLVLPVDKVLILIGEDLPPSRVGAPDLHVVSLTRVLDIK
jgi:hypothetical protein